MFLLNPDKEKLDDEGWISSGLPLWMPSQGTIQTLGYVCVSRSQFSYDARGFIEHGMRVCLYIQAKVKKSSFRLIRGSMLSLIDLVDLLEPIRGKSVLVIGDIFLDHFTYLHGRSKFHRDQQGLTRGEDVCEDPKEYFALGGAALAAKCVSILGGKAYLIGRVGQKSYSKKVKDRLRRKSIRFYPMFDDRPTIAKHYFFAKEQEVGDVPYKERFRYDDENDSLRAEIGQEIEEQIEEIANENIKNIHSILMWDFDKGLITRRLVKTLVDLARENRKPMIAKPKIKWDKYEPLKERLGSTKSCLVVASWDDAVDGLGMSESYVLDIGDQRTEKRKWEKKTRQVVGELLKTYTGCDYFLISRAVGGMVVVLRKQGLQARVPYDVFRFDKTESSGISIGHRELVGAIIAMSLPSPEKDFWKTTYAACCVATMQLKNRPPWVISWKSLPSKIQAWDRSIHGEWPKMIGKKPKFVELPIASEIQRTMERLEMKDYDWIKTSIPGYFTTNGDFKDKLSRIVTASKNARELAEKQKKGAVCLHIFGESRTGKGYLAERLANFFGFAGLIKVNCTTWKVHVKSGAEPIDFESGEQVLFLGIRHNNAILIDEIDKIGRKEVEKNKFLSEEESKEEFNKRWLCLDDQKYSKSLVMSTTSFENAEKEILIDLRNRIIDKIKIPPLRERKSDIPYLVADILGNKIKITKKAIEFLMIIDYTRNFRDLLDIIGKGNLLKRKGEIILSDHIKDALEICGFTIPESAFYSDDDVLEIQLPNREVKK